ncbi:MAG: hypothetical protein QF926_07185 [Alphaproteobacteria bacterium]|nr:hypothetical protein [Alphaproteobacteria bacterium]MDP6516389.1 hypothetical protein [Alphaproteobacteria bacterium]
MAIAMEAFYAIEDKAAMISEVFSALKPVSQFVLTDYVRADDSEPSPALRSWIETEVPRPYLWTPDQMVEALVDAGFEVEDTIDVTRELHRNVLKHWVRYTAGLKPGSLKGAAAAAVIAEVEYWFRRLALLESGDLRCYRIHALRRGITPKSY